jgi:hypothetical protein
MDVNLANSIPYSIPQASGYRDTISGTSGAEKKPEIPFPFAKEDSEAEKIREQFIMNLEQVQNFLYMMIGSKIRIETDQQPHGRSVNVAV